MRIKTEEKRTAILEAAKGVFLRHGFEAASMAEIAAQTGGSKQTLYSYFPSKAELFIAVMLEHGARLILPAFQRLDGDQDFAEGLRAFGRALLEAISHADVVAFRRVLVAEGARSGVGRPFYESGPLIGRTRLAGFFDRQIAAGRMKPVSSALAAEQFLALCEGGPLKLYMEGVRGPLDAREIADAAEASASLLIAAYGIP